MSRQDAIDTIQRLAAQLSNKENGEIEMTWSGSIFADEEDTMVFTEDSDNTPEKRFGVDPL